MDGVLVAGDAAPLRAPVVVNAAGPHSSKITALAFGDEGVVPNDMAVSTRAMRQEVAWVFSPPGFDQGRDGVVTACFDVGVLAAGGGRAAPHRRHGAG